jgi:hypothetical protein
VFEETYTLSSLDREFLEENEIGKKLDDEFSILEEREEMLIDQMEYKVGDSGCVLILEEEDA